LILDGTKESFVSVLTNASEFSLVGSEFQDLGGYFALGVRDVE
jgi:hypothetical protein